MDWLIVDIIQWGAANLWSLAVVGFVLVVMLVLAGSLLISALTSGGDQ